MALASNYLPPIKEMSRFSRALEGMSAAIHMADLMSGQISPICDRCGSTLGVARRIPSPPERHARNHSTRARRVPRQFRWMSGGAAIGFETGEMLFVVTEDLSRDAATRPEIRSSSSPCLGE